MEEKYFSNIQKACETRLLEIYAAGIPKLAEERLKKELAIFRESDLLTSFEEYRRISEAARRMSIPMLTSNGSFIAYLLGYMGVNPLPAHYYCPKCGTLEGGDDLHIIGMDLPEKKCSCGEKMITFGIGIPFECLIDSKRNWTAHDLTIRSSKALQPFAKKILCDMYGAERIIALGIKTQKNDGSPNVYWTNGGYAIMPESFPKEELNDDLLWLNDGEPCIEYNCAQLHGFRLVYLITTQPLEILHKCQNRTGVFAVDIPEAELTTQDYKALIRLNNTAVDKKVLAEMKPATKLDICRLMSALHSTIGDQKGTAIFTSESFQEYPFIEREDFMAFLLDKEIPENDAITAYTYFSKGRSTSEEFRQNLEKYGFDDGFFEAMKKYRYVFPRFHHAAFLQLYLMLAYYLKAYRKEYFAAENKVLSTSE